MPSDIIKLLPRVRNKIKRLKSNYPGAVAVAGYSDPNCVHSPSHSPPKASSGAQPPPLPASASSRSSTSKFVVAAMTQRAKRFPPLDARMVRLEEGPPMYRMLGYLDENNMNTDICDPLPKSSNAGGFAIPRLLPNQVFTFGPGRYGLPQATLPFTTYYWSDCAYMTHQYVTKRPQNRLHTERELPVERTLAKVMPEMAIPGSGVNSRCCNSGYHYIPGIPPPGAGRGQK